MTSDVYTPRARTFVQAYWLSERRAAYRNDWIITDPDEAERWYIKHLEELEAAKKKATEEAEGDALVKKYHPYVEASVPIVEEKLILEMIDASLLQAALDILREKVEKFTADEKAKRAKQAAAKAEEAAKANARAELAEKRKKEKKAKELKEKKEMEAMKKQAKGGLMYG